MGALAAQPENTIKDRKNRARILKGYSIKCFSSILEKMAKAIKLAPKE
jgi:hypothetical protein